MNKSFEWKRASPETQGMEKRRALLIVRNDRIVYEKYAGGRHEKKEALHGSVG